MATKYEQRMERRGWLFIVILLVSLLGASLFGGCTKRITTETVRYNTDTIVQIQYRTITDSVIKTEYSVIDNRDSIAPILDSLNRVIGYDRWHFRSTQKYSDSNVARLQCVIDSLSQNHSDVQAEIKVEYRDVPRKVSWVESSLMWIGLATVLYGIYRLAKLVTLHL